METPHYVGARRWGARVTPLESQKKYRERAFLLLFLHVGAFLLRFSAHGPFSPWRDFSYFFVHVGGICCPYGWSFLGLALPPPPLKISDGAHNTHWLTIIQFSNNKLYTGFCFMSILHIVIFMKLCITSVHVDSTFFRVRARYYKVL